MLKNNEEFSLPSFSPTKFYGTQHHDSVTFCERLGAILARMKHMQENPLSVMPQGKLLGPPLIWLTYFQQECAIQRAKQLGQGVMVFSFEGKALGKGGRRNFVVCHPEIMWECLITRPPELRCAYEVILEGAPCKLYLDLEFSRLVNPNCNGALMMLTLIAIFSYFIQNEFSISCSQSDIINLDSSSSIKFSRHLIFNVEGLIFESNFAAGSFIKMVCNSIRNCFQNNLGFEEIDISQNEISTLFVNSLNGGKRLFCDEGVYTKNRNFRVYKSTKYSKNTPLEVSYDSKYHHCCNKAGEKRLFLDSLITYFINKPKILCYRPVENETKLSNARVTNIFSEGMNRKPSPYTEVDEFILTQIPSGYIRSWQYFQKSEIIVYEVGNYRYCHNIGREHKSNGIMIVVNLKCGVYYQKCHDPDCMHFKSAEKELPSWTMPWKLFVYDFLSFDGSIDDGNDDLFFLVPQDDVPVQKNNCANSICMPNMLSETFVPPGNNYADTKTESSLKIDSVSDEEIVHIASNIEQHFDLELLQQHSEKQMS